MIRCAKIMVNSDLDLTQCVLFTLLHYTFDFAVVGSPSLPVTEFFNASAVQASALFFSFVNWKCTSIADYLRLYSFDKKKKKQKMSLPIVYSIGDIASRREQLGKKNTD